jgi:hypothetical protein
MSYVGGGWRSGQAGDITGAASTATTTGLSPTTAARGGGAIVLTVNGTGFVSGAVVYANYSAQTTTFVSATQLTVQQFSPMPDSGAAGSISVAVRNAPNQALSNAQTFTAT